MPTKILAQRYNSLQTRIATIMGNPVAGSPNTGYGQTVSSSQVSSGTSKVRSTEYTLLANDMSKARYHQIGSSFGGISPVIPAGANRAKVLESYVQTLESLMTQIETDKDTSADSQKEIDTIKQTSGLGLITSSSTPWNNSLSFEFNITFSSLTAYRSYFNAGGKIQISISGTTNLTQEKSNRWATIANRVRITNFMADSSSTNNTTLDPPEFTSPTGGRNIAVGSTVRILNYTPTSTSYPSSNVTIAVTRTSNTNLKFVMTLNDNAVENIDELVRTSFVFAVYGVRPNGALSNIVVPYPTGTAIVTTLL